jgi:ArsR family transcriptional regulator
VSRHLRLLREAGLLDRFREQQRVYYRTPATASRPGWLRELLALMDPEDPELQGDMGRVAAVVGDRERLAAGGPGVEEPGLDGLQEALREELGCGDLGELLDIGTGSGRIVRMLGGQARRAVGLDRSSAALRVARARLHGRGLNHCEFRCGDMYALAYAAASFDTVIINRVLATAERPVDVLAEAVRVLRRAGRLLVIEAHDDFRSRSGLNPPLALRQWLDGLGLALLRSRSCALAGGDYVLALAQRA